MGVCNGNEFIARGMNQQNGDVGWLLCCPGSFSSSYPAFEGCIGPRNKGMAEAHAVNDNSCCYNHPGNSWNERTQLTELCGEVIFDEAA